MFKKTEYGVGNEQGVEVIQINRHQILYQRPDRSATFEMEISADNKQISIYMDSKRRWDPPHDREAIWDADKERVRRELKEAFAFKGMEVEF